MDSFQTLSPELRIQILVCLHDCIPSAIKASPVLLATYQANKNYIRRRFYEQEFDKEMMQDALAIAQFPTLEAHERLMSPPIKQHAKRWLSQDFAYPKQDDSAILVSFDKLHRDIRRLTKEALSEPGAGGTFKLACFSQHHRAQHGTIYKLIRLPTRISVVDELSSHARKQFYQVFLRRKFIDAFMVYAKSPREAVQFNRMLLNDKKDAQE
ncbi:hypothetical protein FSPOR_4633 [Fusarium sporotrichioides]|uniref:Uncharacterized protein n=1 Tax=Fusarium sporotrichioides TaxID=5514 RepID=A0A395SBS4_FUSSP|nr:hypothetical protein FSPOR_4633 [Fusarium sporotrichioides]